MKRCPFCKRTFEDTFTFCLADGGLLDPPFDPTAGEPRASSAPSGPITQVMPNAPPRPPVFHQSVMATSVAPAMQPTAPRGNYPARQTVPPRQTVRPGAKNPQLPKRTGSPVNAILIVGAVLAFLGAIYLTATTDSKVFVIGAIATALVLVLIWISRK